LYRGHGSISRGFRGEGRADGAGRGEPRHKQGGGLHPHDALKKKQDEFCAGVGLAGALRRIMDESFRRLLRDLLKAGVGGKQALLF